MSESKHPVEVLPEEEIRIWELLDEAQGLLFQLRARKREWEKGERRLKSAETLIFATMDTLCPECRCGCSSCGRFHEELDELLFRKYWTS